MKTEALKKLFELGYEDYRLGRWQAVGDLCHGGLDDWRAARWWYREGRKHAEIDCALEIKMPIEKGS